MAFIGVLSMAGSHQRTMLRVRHVNIAICKPTCSDIVGRSSRAGQKASQDKGLQYLKIFCTRVRGEREKPD